MAYKHAVAGRMCNLFKRLTNKRVLDLGNCDKTRLESESRSRGEIENSNTRRFVTVVLNYVSLYTRFSGRVLDK